LGEQTFGDACADQVAQGGSMAPENFTGFLDVMRRHAHAQLVGRHRTRPPDEFAEFIGVAHAVVNTPELAAPIHEAWGEAAAMLSGFPAGLQHGDLHVFNTCPGGIIDLEGAGWAPVGYDVATAVLESTLAEPRWVDGQLALQGFTPDQVRTYLEVLDEEFHRFELPGPSTQIQAHLVCRAINLNSHAHPDASIWEARQFVLTQVLHGFLDQGQVPLTLTW
jgi:Phosphotransferase enzyme family